MIQEGYIKSMCTLFDLGYDYTHSNIKWGISRVCAC